MSQGDAASHTEPAGSAGAGWARHRPTSETLAILGVGIALAALMLTGYGGLRADMRALRGDVNTLASELRGEMGELRGEMNALARDLRSDLGVIRDDVAGLREEVGDLRRDVATLREEVEEIQADAAVRTEASPAVPVSGAGRGAGGAPESRLAAWT